MGKFVDSVAEVQESGDSALVKGLALRRVYEEEIRAQLDSKGQIDEEELRAIFKSIEASFFLAGTSDYGSRKVYLSALGGIVDELSHRGIDYDEEVNAYHEDLVMSRDFSAARKLKATFPGTSFRDYQRFELPSIRGPFGAMAYSAIDDGRLALAKAAIPAKGGYVVVVIGCHFAVDAARVIAGNAALSKIMSANNVFWLLSDSVLDQQVLNSWNKSFPAFKAMIAFDNAGWTGVDFSATPTFHFFRDGKLVEAREGWGADDDLAGLLASLKNIGLIDTP